MFLCLEKFICLNLSALLFTFKWFCARLKLWQIFFVCCTLNLVSFFKLSIFHHSLSHQFWVYNTTKRLCSTLHALHIAKTEVYTTRLSFRGGFLRMKISQITIIILTESLNGQKIFQSIGGIWLKSQLAGTPLKTSHFQKVGIINN